MGTATRTRLLSPSTSPSMAPQHSLGNSDSAWATMASHAPGSIRIIPKRLAEVFLRAIAKHRDDDAALAGVHPFLCDLAGGYPICSRPDAAEQGFPALQAARHGGGFLRSD